MKLVPNVPVLSPILKRFHKQLKKSENKQAELDKFWKKVQRKGTPLYEKIKTEPDYYLVTFLFQSNRRTNELFVHSSIFGWIDQRAQMGLLEGTNVYYKSIFVLNQTYVSYFIRQGALQDIDSPQQPNHDELVLDPYNKTYHTVQFPNRKVCFHLLQTPDYVTYPLTKETIPEGTMDEYEFPCEPMIQAINTAMKSHIPEDTKYKVSIYKPYNYNETTTYKSLTLYDGDIILRGSKENNIIRVFDQMIYHEEMQPIIIILIHQINRMVELWGNDIFNDFVANTVRKKLYTKYNIDERSESNAIGGYSLGGLQAAHMGLFHSQHYGNAMCLSPSMWAPKVSTLGKISDDDKELSQYIINKYVKEDTQDTKFYISIGRYETPETIGFGPNHYWSIRHFRDVLLSKGYDVHYIENNQSHSFLFVKDNVVDAMKWFFS
ncbi:alpha/beta hydrolase [Candidatus Xianfuyuplasma coldseepsis]|uniref:Esterase n=1 Tax=Candidatus Xianfuyuplasma coldseepsis TaxID=2782163 RepID=A0A7L7KU24_9MOLU|nr:alpha/beta hydrolase-fold protein [Xianfuyuplasma coldseepsis]QMS85278.1 hypothetical protein G4Z02_05780 [Xianfuyuplasma coldseepsis]